MAATGAEGLAWILDRRGERHPASSVAAAMPKGLSEFGHAASGDSDASARSRMRLVMLAKERPSAEALRSISSRSGGGTRRTICSLNSFCLIHEHEPHSRIRLNALELE
jgi:hypothetical protein